MTARTLLMLLLLTLLASCTREQPGPLSDDPGADEVHIVRHYYDAWGVDTIDVAMADIRPDAILHKQRGTLSIATWIEAQTWLTMTAPDARFTIDGIVSHGTTLAVRWRLRGTDAQGWLTGHDGQSFQLTGTTVERLEHGKVVELWCGDIPELHRLPAGEPGADPAWHRASLQPASLARGGG